MTATAMLHDRVDEETKEQAAAALKAMGMTVSEAIRVFLRTVAVEQSLPFAIKAPNAATRGAMEEARAINAARGARHADAKDLMHGLEAQSSKRQARKSSEVV